VEAGDAAAASASPSKKFQSASVSQPMQPHLLAKIFWAKLRLNLFKI